MSNDPLRALGEYLSADEAESLAVLLEAGEHTTHALASVGAARRDRVAELLKAAGIGHLSRDLSVVVLRSVAGDVAEAGRVADLQLVEGDAFGVEATLGEPEA